VGGGVQVVRRIGGVADGGQAFRLTLAGPAPASMAALVAAVNTAIGTAGLTALLQASESLADGSAGAGCLKLASLTAGESSGVVIAGGAFGGLSGSIHLGLANGGREFTGNAQHRPAEVANLVPPTKGVDGTRAGANEIVGSASGKTGMHALQDVDLFNLLSIPETYDMTDLQAAAVIPAAVDLCEKRRVQMERFTAGRHGAGDSIVREIPLHKGRSMVDAAFRAVRFLPVSLAAFKDGEPDLPRFIEHASAERHGLVTREIRGEAMRTNAEVYFRQVHLHEFRMTKGTLILHGKKITNTFF